MKHPSTGAIARKLIEARLSIPETLRARTRELALRAGRTPPQVEQADYEQAKRELTGESEIDRQDVVINSMQAAMRDPQRSDPSLRLIAQIEAA